MKIAKERVLFNNYDYEMYTESAKESLLEDYEEDEITTEMIDETAEDFMQTDYEEMIYTLNNFFEGKTFICFGSVGRWNGVYEGGKIFDDFEEAFYEMVKDCYYYKIYDENGHLFVHCSHHDGSCSFEIKVLNDKGKKYFDNWNYSYSDNRSEKEVHNQIIKRYSVLPNIMYSVYGCPKIENIEATKTDLQNKLNNKARSFYS